MGEIEHKWDRFFIRPVEDSKTFSGTVYDWVTFEAWRKEVLNSKYQNRLNHDTQIMMSPLKKIYREARFFVVDIALTDAEEDEGKFSEFNWNKIIEINTFNSSGFYACDIEKIVMAVESMKFMPSNNL